MVTLLTVSLASLPAQTHPVPSPELLQKTYWIWRLKQPHKLRIALRRTGVAKLTEVVAGIRMADEVDMVAGRARMRAMQSLISRLLVKRRRVRHPLLWLLAAHQQTRRKLRTRRSAGSARNPSSTTRSRNATTGRVTYAR